MPETIKTKIVGVSKKNENGRSRQEIIEEELSEGDDLSLVREPENRYDDNAIAVYPGLHFDADDTDDRIGYLSGELAEKLAPMMDSGQYIECTVLNITGGDEDKSLGVNILLNIHSPEESKIVVETVTRDLASHKETQTSPPAQDYYTLESNKANKPSWFLITLKKIWNWYWGIVQHGSSKARIFLIIATLWLLITLCSLPSTLFPSTNSTPAATPEVNIQTAVAIEGARMSTEISLKATQTQAVLSTAVP